MELKLVIWLDSEMKFILMKYTKYKNTKRYAVRVNKNWPC